MKSVLITVIIGVLAQSILAQDFAGSVLDNDAKISYLRARYYDPETGGFLNRDPLGIGGG